MRRLGHNPEQHEKGRRGIMLKVDFEYVSTWKDTDIMSNMHNLKEIDTYNFYGKELTVVMICGEISRANWNGLELTANVEFAIGSGSYSQIIDRKGKGNFGGVRDFKIIREGNGYRSGLRKVDWNIEDLLKVFKKIDNGSLKYQYNHYHYIDDVLTKEVVEI
jgi:hypothetical protein